MDELTTTTILIIGANPLWLPWIVILSTGINFQAKVSLSETFAWKAF